jgi:hypothetical protein
MPLTGQASGGWTESSSALRILHVGVRNTVGVLTDDSFTQTNPPIVTAALAPTTVSQSPGCLTEVLGVLSGSVAFTRPDAGSNFIGGPTRTAPALPADLSQVLPLGCFINSAAGNPYENLPAVASGKGPYVAAMGTYGNRLFETELLITTGGVGAGADLTYVTGMRLVASRNGYLMPDVVFNGAALVPVDTGVTATSNSLEASNVAGAVATLVGVLKMPPDSVQNEIVFDQRI